jgi:hypothetical protein
MGASKQDGGGHRFCLYSRCKALAAVQCGCGKQHMVGVAAVGALSDKCAMRFDVVPTDKEPGKMPAVR